MVQEDGPSGTVQQKSFARLLMGVWQTVPTFPLGPLYRVDKKETIVSPPSMIRVQSMRTWQQTVKGNFRGRHSWGKGILWSRSMETFTSQEDLGMKSRKLVWSITMSPWSAQVRRQVIYKRCGKLLDSGPFHKGPPNSILLLSTITCFFPLDAWHCLLSRDALV